MIANKKTIVSRQGNKRKEQQKQKFVLIVLFKAVC